MTKPDLQRERESARQCGWLVALALATCAALPAAGQEEHAHTGEEAHTHVPLIVDPALDWATLMATTLAAHPQSGELVARGVEAGAWQRRGKRWLAAAPSFYFSYLSDSSLDNMGQRQYESGVELPLWRAGQRSAV
jgi:outer membrane protein, heavy metal efflux system